MPSTLSHPPIPDPSLEQTNERSFSLTEHLEELRRRLGISLAALLVTSSVSFMSVERLIAWLRRPAGELIPRFAFFSPTEALVAYLKVAVLGGVLVAMPIWLWQLWAFIRPALKPRERAAGFAFVGWGSALFLGGACFAYAVLLPVALRVLLGVGSGTLEPVISIDRYLSFVTTMIVWCGLMFELPAVLFLLAKAGIVTPEWLRQQRPYAILVLVIIAAVVTPTTDVLSLLLMTIPLLVLYEVSILMTRLAMRRRR